MKVFISQSLPRSLELARALEGFIRKVVPGTQPWVSDSGIDKGARFMLEIRDNLRAAAAGIVCLTSENLNEAWILYESGALATKTSERVWTVLLDVEPANVPDPLKEFNHTKPVHDDMWKLVQSVHKTIVAAGENTCSTTDLEAYFEAFWPSLEEKIAELQAQAPVPRTTQDPQAEILGLVREIAQRIASESWKQEKSLAMLHVIYAASTGSAAPPLEALKQIGEELRAKAAIDGLRRAISSTDFNETRRPLRPRKRRLHPEERTPEPGETHAAGDPGEKPREDNPE